MISVHEAQQIMAGALCDWGEASCALPEVHNRVLRSPLLADRDQPPFDRVMMDGIAIRYEDFSRGRRTFNVQASQGAGQAALVLQDGAHCIEIMTGAMLPDGCDCVVPVEQVATVDGQAVLQESAEAQLLRFVHARGSDYRRSDVLLEAGTRMRSPEVAIAASIGASTLTVARLPRIAVVASGDELVDVHDAVLPYQIRRSNDYAIAAALQGAGFASPERFHVIDNPERIESLIGRLLQDFDVLVLSGGVSMGKYDYLPAVFKALGVELGFHRVAQRPGKPLWFGTGPRRQAVFALPGNPVSALTCLHRHVLPSLRQNIGIREPAGQCVALSEAVTFAPPLTWFLPVELAVNEQRVVRARPRLTNTSGDFAGLSRSDGFVELPADQQAFAEGFEARYFSW